MAEKTIKKAEMDAKTAEMKQEASDMLTGNDNSPEMGDLIEGETRSGLKFKINAAIREDTRVLYLLTRMQTESLPIMEKSKALFNLMEVIFGSGEGFFTFQNEVAYRHGGIVNTQTLMEEISDIIEATKLKN